VVEAAGIEPVLFLRASQGIHGTAANAFVGRVGIGSDLYIAKNVFAFVDLAAC
jgi:hypothetical protein